MTKNENLIRSAAPFVFLSKQRKHRFHLNDRVVLVSNKHREGGVCRGDSGGIVYVFDDGDFLVEFSEPETGNQIALIKLNDHEIVEWKGNKDLSDSMTVKKTG